MTTTAAPVRARKDGGTWPAVAAFGGIVLVVALVGSVATSSSVDSDWFRTLDKPSWYPPSSAFGIVWTILYVMIAASAALAWRAGASWPAIGAWGTQMALNLAWSVVFFGLRAPTAALVVIVALLVGIVATIALFRPVDRVAAALLLPYLAWMVFATALNAAIVSLD